MARTFVKANSDYINGSASPVSAAPVSVSIWYYPVSNSTDQELLLINHTSIDDGFRLECNWTLSSNLLSFCARHLGLENDASTAAPNLSAWNHIAGTISGGGSQLTYLNGTQVVSTTWANGSPTSLNRFFIGAVNGSFNFVDGRLADVAVWNVVLTPIEIAALNSGVRPNQIRPNALVAWWPLDGLQSPEPDLSGSANNGTVHGTSVGFGPPITMFTPRWPQLVPPPPVAVPPPAAFDWPLPYRPQPGNIDLRGGSRGTPSNFITPTGTPPKGQFDWPVPNRAPFSFFPRDHGGTALYIPSQALPFSQFDWPVPKAPPHTAILGRPQSSFVVPPLGTPPIAYYDWPVPKAPTPGAIDLRWVGQGTPVTLFPVLQVQPFNQYTWPVPASYLSSVDLKTWNQSIALTIQPTGTLMGAMWM